MELRQLERFLAVVEHGSLAEAARHCQLTQQAVSASIAGLERELGVRLFDRAPGGVTRLTELGRALLPHARAQIAADQRARQELTALASARAGTVTLGVGETFAGDIVAAAVGRALRERPDLRINLIEGYSEQLLQRLYHGEFDFVAAGISSVQLPPGFGARVLYSANDVVACGASHPLAGHEQLSLAELQGFPWLVPYSRPSDTQTICEAFVLHGLTPPTRFVGSDAYRVGMKLLANNDLLIMASPALLRSTLARQQYGVVILPVSEPTVTRNASLVSGTERPLTPAARWLFDAVVEAAVPATDAAASQSSV